MIDRMTCTLSHGETQTMKNLNATELAALLKDLSAWSDYGGAEWAERKSLAENWRVCHRGDCMLWLAARYGDVPLKTLVVIACDAAEPATALTADPRPAQILAAVRRWLKDEATLEEVEAAAVAARGATTAALKTAWWVARVATGVASAAWVAVWMAALAARDAAAEAVDLATRAQERDAAEAESLQFSADRCRKYITVEETK